MTGREEIRKSTNVLESKYRDLFDSTTSLRLDNKDNSFRIGVKSYKEDNTHIQEISDCEEDEESIDMVDEV